MTTVWGSVGGADMARRCGTSRCERLGLWRGRSLASLSHCWHDPSRHHRGPRHRQRRKRPRRREAQREAGATHRRQPVHERQPGRGSQPHRARWLGDGRQRPARRSGRRDGFPRADKCDGRGRGRGHDARRERRAAGGSARTSGRGREAGRAGRVHPARLSRGQAGSGAGRGHRRPDPCAKHRRRPCRRQRHRRPHLWRTRDDQGPAHRNRRAGRVGVGLLRRERGVRRPLHARAASGGGLWRDRGAAFDGTAGRVRARRRARRHRRASQRGQERRCSTPSWSATARSSATMRWHDARQRRGRARDLRPAVPLCGHGGPARDLGRHRSRGRAPLARSRWPLAPTCSSTSPTRATGLDPARGGTSCPTSSARRPDLPIVHIANKADLVPDSPTKSPLPAREGQAERTFTRGLG